MENAKKKAEWVERAETFSSNSSGWDTWVFQAAVRENSSTLHDSDYWRHAARPSTIDQGTHESAAGEHAGK